MTPFGSAATSRRVPGVLVLAVVMVVSVTLLAPASNALEPTKEIGGPGIGPDPAPTAEARAVELLRRVAEADATIPYIGTQFVSAWSPSGTASALVEVQNIPGHGTALRVRGSGSGPASAIFSTAPGDGLELPIGGGPIGLLDDNYSLSTAGGGRATVAGRRAQVVEMRGAEGVLAARFWVHERTGLVLRRERYDDSGRTVRASAFVQVQIGPRAAPSHLPPMPQSAVARSLGLAEVSALQHDGWHAPTTLAGHLALYEMRQVQTASGPVLHLSYSDGLSTVSLFQQAGSLPADGLDGYARVASADGVRYLRSGIPEQVVWAADGVVYAVVADAPPATVAQVVADLPHSPPPADGMLDRLGRGLGRVGSWVNPFG